MSQLERAPKKRPRPAVKLTPALIEKLAQQVSSGMYVAVAARNLGLEPSQVYSWLQQAEEPGAKKILRDFAAAMHKAESQAELHAVLVVRKSMQSGDWRAAIEYLKRRHPERWGDHMDIRHSGEVTIVRKATAAELDAFAGETIIEGEVVDADD